MGSYVVRKCRPFAEFKLGFLCSFLFRLWSAHERKERAADIPPVKYAVVYSF